MARLRGLEHERGRLEVGLADAEREDVDALGTELGGARGDGDGGRGLDDVEALRE